MQQYKSVQNAHDEQKLEKRMEKRKGEVPYSLDANRSGKICVQFTKEYVEAPYVFVSNVVLEGSEFDVKTILTSVTTKEFVINVQNSSVEPIKGNIMWILM